VSGQDLLGDLRTILPALLFLCTAVPLAALLDATGFFSACAAKLCGGRDRVPVLALWVLAAATTAVLNLDTTIVLLTPLYARLALRTGSSPLALAGVPLLLASLASSVLPVSNLTTIIAAERLELGVLDVLTHTAAPSLVACAVGWWCYRRRHPSHLRGTDGPPPSARALRVGGAVVAFVLVGFTLGPSVGVHAWVVALVADAALVVVTRRVPWREVPIVTAAAVAAVAAVVGLLPVHRLHDLLVGTGPWSVVAAGMGGTASANLVNNLPSALWSVRAVDEATWGFWSWLLAINTSAVLLPIGAVANLLWWRIVRAEGIEVDLRGYLRLVVPVAAPAAGAALAVLVVQQQLWG
jgi:arsenical pump membrane protein